MKRRQLLTRALAGTVAWSSGAFASATPGAMPRQPAAAPDLLARDESYWAEVGRLYDRTQGIINLEHGYWGKMARPVQDAYLATTRMVNAQNSYYGRRKFDDDAAVSRRRIARALGVHEDEIVITRNATEAVHNLLRQYRALSPGDTVLFADVDYPNFKTTAQWLAKERRANAVELKLQPRTTQAILEQLYLEAFDANPSLRLMLITHVSNQHGLVIPVAQIAAEARRRGIDVIGDCAQSWGLLDFRLPDLGLDWAAFNLHKWIGAPVGLGALYLKRGSLEKIAPYPGENDPTHTDAQKRVHLATSNFAAILSIPAALDFHEALGPANKEARLRYLRSLWSSEAESMPHLEVLGGHDEASWTGIGSFRLAGRSSRDDAVALQKRLENDFGLFTVARHGLASGSCVRVTPQVFNSAQELSRLVAALKSLA